MQRFNPLEAVIKKNIRKNKNKSGETSSAGQTEEEKE